MITAASWPHSQHRSDNLRASTIGVHQHTSRKYSAIQDGQALLLQSLTVSAVPTEHSTGTHPPQRGAGNQGAAALAVTGPPLSRWTQPCARRFALYWLRAATRACPAASTTSVDDARTATLRPGSSTSSSTSPTASLPGPTE
jgi:hypothetical protein